MRWTVGAVIWCRRLFEPINAWFQREEVPDSFVVKASTGERWHTYSRTWALLRAVTAQGLCLFVAGSQNRIEKTTKGLYSPLPAGRWATASCGMSPAATREDRYVYSGLDHLTLRACS
jgi:hypothetical protein